MADHSSKWLELSMLTDKLHWLKSHPYSMQDVGNAFPAAVFCFHWISEQKADQGISVKTPTLKTTSQLGLWHSQLNLGGLTTCGMVQWVIDFVISSCVRDETIAYSCQQSTLQVANVFIIVSGIFIGIGWVYCFTPKCQWLVTATLNCFVISCFYSWTLYTVIPTG